MLIPGFPVPVFGGVGPSLIVSQDETNYNGTGDNGTFAGGAAGGLHDVGVTLTLSNGATVMIDANAGSPNSRAVTQFTVTATGPATAGETYTSTTTNFSITPGANNIE